MVKQKNAEMIYSEKYNFFPHFPFSEEVPLTCVYPSRDVNVFFSM